MKRGPLIHGVLLVVALLFAYKTWTRDKTEKPNVGDVAVWDKGKGTFEAIAFQSAKKQIRVSWKEENKERFLWGEVSREKPKAGAPRPKKGEKGETEVETRYFPLGKAGDELVANFTNLKALRSLGKLDDEKKAEFGLAEAKDNLTVFFKGGKQETLVVGSRVYGGSDRYVIHAESGNAYVLSTNVVRPIESGEGSLRLKKMHEYEKNDPERVQLIAGDDKKEMVRVETDDAKGKRKAWAYADKKDKPDQTLDNFLNRVATLAPTSYYSEVDGLEKVITLEYQKASGKKMGYVEFYRKVPPELAQATDAKKDAPGVPDILLAQADQKKKAKALPTRGKPKAPAKAKTKAAGAVGKPAPANRKVAPRIPANQPKPLAPPVRVKGNTPQAKQAAAMEAIRRAEEAMRKKKEAEGGAALPKKKKGPEIEYYIRTERTHSFGKVPRLAAERFDADVAELFGRPPPPTTPTTGAGGGTIPGHDHAKRFDPKTGSRPANKNMPPAPPIKGGAAPKGVAPKPKGVAPKPKGVAPKPKGVAPKGKLGVKAKKPKTPAAPKPKAPKKAPTKP